MGAYTRNFSGSRHSSVLCQPPEKEEVWVTQEMEQTMIKFAKLLHTIPPFKRRTTRKLTHALGMPKSCFGIVCHDGRGMRTMMACEVDNDINLPY